MNKKKKSTNLSPYPDEAIERLARAFYPAILACWNSEEGQREFAAWQAEQAHLSGKEKQEVPDGELPALLIESTKSKCRAENFRALAPDVKWNPDFPACLRCSGTIRGVCV